MTAHSENGNAIRERINALDRDEKRNRDNIAELFRSLEEKGKTNWQVIISGFSVLIILTSGILGFTVAPLYTALDELKRQNRLDDKKYLHKAVSDEYRTRIEERLRRHTDDIRAIVARMVDKAELAHTQRSVDDIQKVLGSLYPLDRVLQDLQRRLDRIQDQIGREERPPARKAP